VELLEAALTGGNFSFYYENRYTTRVTVF